MISLTAVFTLKQMVNGAAVTKEVYATAHFNPSQVVRVAPVWDQKELAPLAGKCAVHLKDGSYLVVPYEAANVVSTIYTANRSGERKQLPEVSNGD